LPEYYLTVEFRRWLAEDKEAFERRRMQQAYLKTSCSMCISSITETAFYVNCFANVRFMSAQSPLIYKSYITNTGVSLCRK
jgi:hypothetical protein